MSLGDTTAIDESDLFGALSESDDDQQVTTSCFFVSRTRVARFFLVQHIKMGNNLTKTGEIYRMALKYAK
jgi:hypothetical protein